MRDRLPGIGLTIAARAILLVFIICAVIVAAALAASWFLIP